VIDIRFSVIAYTNGYSLYLPTRRSSTKRSLYLPERRSVNRFRAVPIVQCACSVPYNRCVLEVMGQSILCWHFLGCRGEHILKCTAMLCWHLMPRRTYTQVHGNALLAFPGLPRWTWEWRKILQLLGVCNAKKNRTREFHNNFCCRWIVKVWNSILSIRKACFEIGYYDRSTERFIWCHGIAYISTGATNWDLSYVEIEIHRANWDLPRIEIYRTNSKPQND